jgi:hypothetical protein
MKDLSVLLENKIIAQYFMNNINVFITYIKSSENFLNLISFYEQPSSNSIRMNMEWFSLISLLKYYQGLEDKLNRSTLKEFLLIYFTYEIKNYDLWHSAYNKIHYELLEYDYEEYYHNIDVDTLEEYQKKLLEKTINPILDKVCINDTLITNDPSISIDIDQIIKNFYKEASKNSFNLAVNEFNNFQESVFPKYIEKDLYTDFVKYSAKAIEEIKAIYNNLFVENIFENKYYATQAKVKWNPLLERSMIFNEFPHSKTLKEAIEVYIFIATMKETISSNNHSNTIIAKYLKKISKLSYIMDCIQDIVNMDNNDFKYFFIKIFKEFCKMSKEELTFVIGKLDGFKVSTFMIKDKQSFFLKLDTEMSLRKIFNIQTNQDIKPYEIKFKNPMEHYSEIQKFKHNNLLSY